MEKNASLFSPEGVSSEKTLLKQRTDKRPWCCCSISIRTKSTKVHLWGSEHCLLAWGVGRRREVTVEEEHRVKMVASAGYCLVYLHRKMTIPTHRVRSFELLLLMLVNVLALKTEHCFSHIYIYLGFHPVTGIQWLEDSYRRRTYHTTDAAVDDDGGSSNEVLRSYRSIWEIVEHKNQDNGNWKQRYSKIRI